jgi:UDP-glucose 4-epimerase
MASSIVIWVTGARGFVGRHVASHAARQGAEVFGLGHGQWLAEDRSLWGLSGWINGDVSESNLDLLARDSRAPNVIFHCAGGSSVGASVQAPLEDFSRSVGSTARLLEWIRQRNPACRFVLISSAAVYGAGHERPISEDSATAPASPYGYHKLSAELLTRSYQQSFGLAAGIVRLFSLYGEELRKQLIWDICIKLKSQPKQLLLGGSGNEIRDFIHVSDAAEFILAVSRQLQASPEKPITVNCGTGQGRSIRSVAEELIAAWGANAVADFSGECRVGDPAQLVADIGQAHLLGPSPKISFAAGARAYVSWFQRSHKST